MSDEKPAEPAKSAPAEPVKSESEKLREIAKAHTDTAHQQHGYGHSAHNSIAYANRANQEAADLERKGR
ncbi:hypothetical protein ACFRMQ_37280 [Kitasatospora sp. NPDC056783]|uniref:hypothetical protein n=1 Tax=Kitasatospora sp. NPDC056783 TaxID=3345943 RepID=UPI0036788431